MYALQVPLRTNINMVLITQWFEHLALTNDVRGSSPGQVKTILSARSGSINPFPDCLGAAPSIRSSIALEPLPRPFSDVATTLEPFQVAMDPFHLNTTQACRHPSLDCVPYALGNRSSTPYSRDCGSLEHSPLGACQSRYPTSQATSQIICLRVISSLKLR